MSAIAADIVFVAIVLVTAAAVALRGAVRAGVALFNAVFSGLLAMNSYESLSGMLASFRGEGGPFVAYSHCGTLTVIALLSFLVLHVITRRLLPENPELPRPLERPLSWILGVGTGYAAAAFLCVAVQTAPGPRDFWGYLPPEPDERSGPIMQFAPDYHWLGFTQHLSERVFRYPRGTRIFDGPTMTVGEQTGRWASFPLRYARWRERLEDDTKSSE